MDEHDIKEAVFVEIKTGNSQLSSNERSLREAIEAKRVRWLEHHVNRNIAAIPASIRIVLEAADALASPP
jgi:predicted Holliday junction resolvase-like endonuclease